MTNPEKPGKPDNTKPKPSAKPPTGAGGVGSLPSEQWLSESTVFAVAQQADGSPSASDTGGPPDPDPCKGKKFLPSGPPSYEGLINATDPSEVGGTEGMPGGTNWGRKPYPAITEIICDGDKKVWRARVITVLYSIVMYIGQPKKKITQGVIDASKCADLAVLFHDLSELIKSDGTDPAQADFWLPPEYVRTHELVHVVHLQEIVNRRYATLVAEIEAITAPCTLSEEDVKKAMADAIEEAQKRYKKGIEDDVIIEKQHIPPKPFIDASIAATQLWLAAVLRKRSELHCP